MRTFRRATLAVISGSKPKRFSLTAIFFSTSARNALKHVSMSVRFRFVIIWEKVVKNLLPTECQKYKTRCAPPPKKREPKTTSARSDKIGQINKKYSAGSYSKSAS